MINLMKLESHMESILHDYVKGIEVIKKSKELQRDYDDYAWNYLVKKGPKSYAIYTSYDSSGDDGYGIGAELYDDYTSYSQALKGWDKANR